MNQNKIISLLDITDGQTSPFGNAQGKLAFRKISEWIDSHPACNVIGVSLNGILATDASFPRESVVAIAKQYRGEKGVYLEGVQNRDILDNWKYAAIAKDQPLVVWEDDKYEVIGPEQSDSNKKLIDFVLQNTSVTASTVAAELAISVQNASTRLKKLVEQGYIMRSEVTAETGGIEYIYHAIK